jgi:hypothetical protein
MNVRARKFGMIGESEFYIGQLKSGTGDAIETAFAGRQGDLTPTPSGTAHNHRTRNEASGRSRHDGASELAFAGHEYSAGVGGLPTTRPPTPAYFGIRTHAVTEAGGCWADDISLNGDVTAEASQDQEASVRCFPESGSGFTSRARRADMEVTQIKLTWTHFHLSKTGV